MLLRSVGVRRGGSSTPPDPGEFTPSWASLTDPAGTQTNTFAAGWAFTVTQELTVTKARVCSTNSGTTARNVAIWRQSDSTVIASTGSVFTTGTGWQEQAFSSPVVLEPGETYVIVVWRHDQADPRVRTQDHVADPWETIPEVTFLEGRVGGYNNNALPSTSTNRINGVDLYLK